MTITPAKQHFIAAWWKRYRFHLSALLILIPVGFSPSFLASVALSSGDVGLGSRIISSQHVGPWQVTLAEWRLGGPVSMGEAGYIKTFTMGVCETCASEIRAAYLRLGKPRSLRTAGALFYGTAYRQFSDVNIPLSGRAANELWLTLEGWDGSVYQAQWPLESASPDTLSFIQKHTVRR